MFGIDFGRIFQTVVLTAKHFINGIFQFWKMLMSLSTAPPVWLSLGVPAVFIYIAVFSVTLIILLRIFTRGH